MIILHFGVEETEPLCPCQGHTAFHGDKTSSPYLGQLPGGLVTLGPHLLGPQSQMSVFVQGR